MIVRWVIRCRLSVLIILRMVGVLHNCLLMFGSRMCVPKFMLLVRMVYKLLKTRRFVMAVRGTVLDER